jgi:hypothetical protein
MGPEHTGEGGSESEGPRACGRGSKGVREVEEGKVGHGRGRKSPGKVGEERI